MHGKHKISLRFWSKNARGIRSTLMYAMNKKRIWSWLGTHIYDASRSRWPYDYKSLIRLRLPLSNYFFDSNTKWNVIYIYRKDSLQLVWLLTIHYPIYYILNWKTVAKNIETYKLYSIYIFPHPFLIYWTINIHQKWQEFILEKLKVEVFLWKLCDQKIAHLLRKKLFWNLKKW